MKKLEKLEKLELFDYQHVGASWLAGKKHALLADKQRLGKTVQAIRATDLIQPYRVLVICRAVARSQWATEFERWGIIPRSIHVNTGKRLSPHGVKPVLNPPPSSVVICSYEGLDHVMAGLIGRFDLVICDESHYLKEPTAKRTRKILGKGGVIHKTERLWLLTGTPAPNHAGELWTMLYTFGGTKLPYMPFIKKYCNTFEGGYGMQIVGTKTDSDTISELRDLLNPIMLRRTEEDVSIQLPSLHITTQTVNPGKVNLEESGLFAKELAMYGPKELMRLIETELGVYNAIVENTASHELIEVLKASAKSISTLRRFTALQKIDALCELITEELREKAYSKVVIFCIHVAAVKIIEQRLREFNPVSVYGGTVDMAGNVEKFQQDPKCGVFIGNINAAGTSINLTVAHHIYFLEQSFVPGENAQAAMRCGGPTQSSKNIFIKILNLDNSVDQKVSEIINRKTEEIGKILEKQNENLKDIL